MTELRTGMVLALACVVLAAQAAPAKRAATVDASVTKIIDGDSLIVEPAVKGPPLEVRLDGIDAPEGCQPWGPEARQALSDFVAGKAVSLQLKGKDSYGRTLAVVHVDGMNINERMVAEGHAWSVRFKWDKGPFMEKERVARALRRGLHSMPGAVMPKDFRRSNGRCTGAPSGTGVKAALLSAPVPLAVTANAPAAFRCDGRTHCSQMRSCAEATYFLQQCPGVKMDGDRNGVPCEKQWCR